jgi:putative peptidoglycan lipid II flippase
MPGRFEKHARTVTVLTFVSRVTGLARDAALSRIFGVTAITDAFWFAFMIPNLFRRLFGEGALSAAFLPVYSQLDRDNPAVARQLATLTIGLMMIFLGGLTVVGEIVLFILMMRSGHNQLAAGLMMIMLPYMPLVCVVAIIGAMLQVHGRFGPTASAPIVLNLFLVAASWGLAGVFHRHASVAQQTAHITIVSWSVLAAGIVQVLWSFVSLRRVRGRSWKHSPHSRTGASGSRKQATASSLSEPLAPERLRGIGGLRQIESLRCRDAFGPMRQVLTQAWPMFIGLGVLQLNTFIDGLIASYPSNVGTHVCGYKFPLESGALTALNNAQRLYEFPLGVFGIAIATAIFPALARVAGNSDREQFADILRRGLRLVMYIGLPASVGLVLVRVPLTAAILQGRNFTSADTARVAFILMGYAPAIWAYSMTHTLTRAFYASGDSMTPVRVAMRMVALNFILNVTLIWTPLKEAGLAWSTAITAMIQVVILLRLTRRYVSSPNSQDSANGAPHIVDEQVGRSWVKSAIVTAAMAVVVIALDAWLTAALGAAGSWRSSVIHLAILVGAGGAAAIVTSLVLRMPELRWALGQSDR